MKEQPRTPLERWLSVLKPAQHGAFKAALGRTASYIPHLAVGRRNASAKTALRIIAAMRLVPGGEPLTVGDLCPALAGLVPAQGGA